MIGRTLGHYRIVGRIGAGGMGEVWRAEDTRLKRQVALKTLPADTAAHPDRLLRFQREAEAVAALDHPNIVTIHSIDEAEGLRFLTMALVEGRTLNELIPGSGMEMSAFFDIAVPLADAMAAAHEHGITHRDVKPANVMVAADGRVKVLDFGLAKLAETSSQEEDVTVQAAHTSTRAGTLVGTASYMSPEQAEGKPVDPRSDVFSLGIVLYEMVTGRRPFRGDSAMGTITAILRDPAPRASKSRTGLPSGLDGLIARCLEKDPGRRFPSASELRDALQEARNPGPSGAIAAAEPAEKSIAVLAFANMSGDPGNEYLSDGISEEIISALVRVPGLRVAGRTSAFSFKGKDADLRSIGEQLNVDTVLEGSVRKAGQRLRVTAQLVNVADGYHLWSERYDRDLDDVFEIQDEIAGAIATKLERTLAGGPDRRKGPGRTADVEAYELFLKGRALIYRRGLAILRGMELLREALVRDPDYAQAHAWLATGHVLVGHYGMAPPFEEFPRAKAAAARALELDPDQPDAHCATAAIRCAHDWDWEDAQRHFLRAIELDAASTQARIWYGMWWLWAVAGKTEEALAQARRAHESDPLNAYAVAGHGMFSALSGRLDEGRDLTARAIELDGSSAIALWARQLCLLWASEYEESIAVGETSLRASGRSPWNMMALAFAYAGAGRPEAARALHDEFSARARREYVQPVCLAGAALASGERDRALDLVTRACEERDGYLPFVARRWPDFEPIRDDPRYRKVLERMRLA